MTLSLPRCVAQAAGRLVCRSRLAVIGLALASLSAFAGAAALPPATQFFQTPLLSGAVLSPDGRALAFRQPGPDGKLRLVVLDLLTFMPTVVASYASDDVDEIRWVNDKRLVFTLKIELTGPNRIDTGPGLVAVNRDGTGLRALVQRTHRFLSSGSDLDQLQPSNTFLVDDEGDQNSDEVLVQSPQGNDEKKVDYIELGSLNTVTGRLRNLDAPLHSSHWLRDAQGKLRVAMAATGAKQMMYYREPDGPWKKIAEFARFDQNAIHPLFIDRADRLYVSANDGDKRAVFTMDPATGKLGAKPVLASAEYDIDPDFIATKDKLLGIRYQIDAEVTAWFDPAMQAVQTSVDALLPATANRISVPAHSATNFVLVQSFSDVQPSQYALFDTKTGKLINIGGTLAPFDPQQLGVMDMVRYKARDGLSIPAYLTLPSGGVKKNLPLLVYVHGGPWVRGGSWGWDSEVQFLASRGYAVLQPEFRGSRGFGRRHMEAGFKQWGLAMQDDLADGARWAIAQGIADPKRICIIGASYGGYATMMGLVKNPDLFRCGVNWVGVTDIDLLYSVGWSDFSDEFKRYGMPGLVGDRVKDAAQFKATSPVAQAARITQPLLLAYGGFDVRVPIVHGEKMRDAVKAHNQQVEWVVYSEEGHGWRKSENKVDFWTRVEKFLGRNLAPVK